jgi:hypothetical protein
MCTFYMYYTIVETICCVCMYYGLEAFYIIYIVMICFICIISIPIVFLMCSIKKEKKKFQERANREHKRVARAMNAFLKVCVACRVLYTSFIYIITLEGPRT